MNSYVKPDTSAQLAEERELDVFEIFAHDLAAGGAHNSYFFGPVRS